MRIVVASGNRNKLREIAEIFRGYEIVSMQAAGFSGEIEETGKTFEENALIKARAVWYTARVSAGATATMPQTMRCCSKS